MPIFCPKSAIFALFRVFCTWENLPFIRISKISASVQHGYFPRTGDDATLSSGHKPLYIISFSLLKKGYFSLILGFFTLKYLSLINVSKISASVQRGYFLWIGNDATSSSGHNPFYVIRFSWLKMAILALF